MPDGMLSVIDELVQMKFGLLTYLGLLLSDALASFSIIHCLLSTELHNASRLLSHLRHQRLGTSTGGFTSFAFIASLDC